MNDGHKHSTTFDDALILSYNSWGKVITLDKVKRRGRALANRCCLCEEDEETIDHLLIHGKMARMLWDIFF